MDFDYKLLCRYSVSITGRKNLDLVHHCISIFDFSQPIIKKEAYLYRMMVNEYRNPKSQFNKLYKPFAQISDIEDTQDYFDLSHLQEKSVDDFKKKYPMEFAIFQETVNTSIVMVSKKTRTHRHTIEKICTFVKSEIKNSL